MYISDFLSPLPNPLRVTCHICCVSQSTCNFNSFPDSHGDDLIVEILEPNGKEFGRALVQLAKFSEDSVSHFYLPFSFVSTYQINASK